VMGQSSLLPALTAFTAVGVLSIGRLISIRKRAS